MLFTHVLQVSEVSRNGLGECFEMVVPHVMLAANILNNWSDMRVVVLANSREQMVHYLVV